MRTWYRTCFHTLYDEKKYLYIYVCVCDLVCWDINHCWLFDAKSIFIHIIIMSCRQHGYPWPSLATSPYHSSLLAGFQGYIPYPHIAAECMFELVVLLLFSHMRGVHWSTSLMSLSLLLQQCPTCLVRLTCIVFVMGGKCPYSWCFVGCCRQDLFNCRLVSSSAVWLASK